MKTDQLRQVVKDGARTMALSKLDEWEHGLRQQLAAVKVLKRQVRKWKS